MTLQRGPRRVSFSQPVIESMSRKPTSVEVLYMNLFEHHIRQCRACEPMRFGISPRYCRRGQAIEGFILVSFSMDARGRIFSALEEWDRPVRVEIGAAYTMVLELLRQVCRPRHMEP
jgi:hypothetical protein